MRFPQETTQLFVTLFTLQANALIALTDIQGVDEKADGGILSSRLLSMNATYASIIGKEMSTPSGIIGAATLGDSTCTAGYVDCIDGFVAGDSSKSCAEECDGYCCVGYEACVHFTGKVCRDGSCSNWGWDACGFATIPVVINSCKGSTWTCIHAGGEDGSVGNMINSCNGYRACEDLGDGGAVGNITNSCNGQRSCAFASGEGFIDPLTCMAVATVSPSVRTQLIIALRHVR